MRITVTVDGTQFEVEINDLSARPVRARIGDQAFEVWPEAAPPTDGWATAPAPRPTHPSPTTAAAGLAGANAVLAPLPGVVVSLAVQPGDEVAAGQPLCVIEAMKMNNTLRSTRAGRIGAVRVTAGQAVAHRQVLLEFAP